MDIIYVGVRLIRLTEPGVNLVNAPTFRVRAWRQEVIALSSVKRVSYSFFNSRYLIFCRAGRVLVEVRGGLIDD